MAMNNALRSRQPDSNAGEFVLTVQTPKWPEQLGGVIHVKTGPVIGDAYLVGQATSAGMNTDRCALGVAGVFPGIAQQIAHECLDGARIADRRQRRINVPIDGA
jgi:hypothetical protein